MQKQVKNLTTASIKKVLSDHGMTCAQGLTMFKLMREHVEKLSKDPFLCFAAEDITEDRTQGDANRATIRDLLYLDGKATNGCWSGKKGDHPETPGGKTVRLQWLDEIIALLKAKPRNTNGDYKPTIDIGAFTRYPEDFRTLRPGQWVAYPEFSPPIRGQFLGITKHGNVIVNWVSGVGMVKQFSSNRQLREYAKLHK